MTQIRRGVFTVLILLVAAGIAQLVDPGGPWTALIVLGGAIALGDLFELRPYGRAALALSFAVAPVVFRAGSAWQALAVLVVAQGATLVLREQPVLPAERAILAGRRLAAMLAAFGAFTLVQSLAADPDGRWVVLGALAIAMAVELAVDDLLGELADHESFRGLRGRSADVAVATSGILMAVGFGGVDGKGSLGLVGALLLAVPVGAAWYAFHQVERMRATYDQTIRALSIVPELVGMSRRGHGERVAALAVATGRRLSLDDEVLGHLEAAAFLHHLGHVILDAPEATGRPVQAVDVAEATARILRGSDVLRPAGDLLADDPDRNSGDEPWPGSRRAAQILAVASTFDELTSGDDRGAGLAIEALRSAPGYVYDGQVLAALEAVLHDRGALTLVGR